MSIDHRLVYKNDVALFLVLAVPGMNAWLTEWLLSWGAGPAIDAAVLTPFVGLIGILGLGFSYLRLRLPDTRITLLTSTAVKLVAAAWLCTIAASALSPAFYLLAGLDLISGLYLLFFVVRG